MKTLNFKTTNGIFAKFALTTIEMIKVRGGGAEGPDPTILPSQPPVKI
jgi:hypothetical protein